MKKAFICSAYSGDVKRNTHLTREHCLYAIDQGYAPFAPHLLYPQFLDDEELSKRIIGIGCGMEFLAVCDLVMVFGDITYGMKKEIDLATELKIPIEYVGGAND